MPKATYPGIPDPQANIPSLVETVQVLKQIVELLAGQRGSSSAHALNGDDLTYLNQQISWIDKRLKTGGL